MLDIGSGRPLLSPASGRDVEQACAVAEETLAEAGKLRSARVRAYIDRFNVRLGPYAVSAAVRRFRTLLPVPAAPS